MMGRCLRDQGTRDQDISCFFVFPWTVRLHPKKDCSHYGLIELLVCYHYLFFFPIDAYYYRLLFFYLVGFTHVCRVIVIHLGDIVNNNKGTRVR